jgi:hypothetical protein
VDSITALTSRASADRFISRTYGTVASHTSRVL